MTKAKQVTNQNFDEMVLQSDKPVLVDFYADWCGPCRALAPVLDEVADEAGDALEVVKLDTDENEEMTRRYEVQVLPTLLLFKDGEPVERFVGVVPKSAILDRTRPHLNLAKVSNS